MKRAILLLFIFFSAFSSQAQNKQFTSVSASTNYTAANNVVDNNLDRHWQLDVNDLKQDQYLMLTLQTAGTIKEVQLATSEISKTELQGLVKIYITYDPMNPGEPLAYKASGNGNFSLDFPPKYGAYLKLLFKGNKINKPISIKEIKVVYASDSGDGSNIIIKERPWMNTRLTTSQRVELLLAVMTPEQKIGLLREGWGIPGIAALGIPPVNKVEAIHGFSYGSGATIFPQSIALGATWDKHLVEQVAETIGDETVNAHTLQAWSPVLDVAQDARWGRCEETYGEDPILVSEIGGAWIKGYQSKGLIVTPKHFAAHGSPLGGRDSQDIGLSEREMREIQLVPFRNVIEKYHCQSIMENYSDYLGVPVAKNQELLIGILREEWGFNGFIVSDCGALRNLTSQKHYTAKTIVDAAKQALAAGVCINCGDTYTDKAVIAAVKSGDIDVNTLNTVDRTLLSTMFRNGYFDEHKSSPLDWKKIYPGWNSPGHKAVARKAEQEAIVMLENKGNLLPLSKSLKKIAVIGPGADDLQPGDYTAKLQPGQLQSVLSGIKKAVDTATTQVIYEKGCGFTSADDYNPDKAIAAASKADAVVMVLGDCSTSEAAKGVKKTSGEANDYATLILPGNQEKLLEAVCATGKPVILVLQSGRPYNLSYASKNCKAILVNWLPGQEGGPATADVLFGDYNPAGRLPMTFPRDVGQLPLYYNFKTSGRGYNYSDMPYYPLYSFGYGLSYTAFNYSGLKALVNDDGMVDVTATVTNTGKVKGDEVAQLYVTDMYASVKTRVMELKDFERITLAPGESKAVSFRLTPYQISLLNDQMDRVVEPGIFKISVGGKSPEYVAADDIKNSVGYKSSADGLSTEINYTKPYKADFNISYAGISTDLITKKKVINVNVKNTGNITDIGKVTLYINGIQKGIVHHYELGPHHNKLISFDLNKIENVHTVMFATKYKSIYRMIN
ncbi:MAG: beta-glucosidase [Mucilaginibacter sp.]|nr:beta-glucosidase [Mucilaginibacter sp.]